MANDKDIVAVIEGPVAVGAESMFAALGDKPVVQGVSVNAVDPVQKSAVDPVRRRPVHPGAVRHVRP